MQFPWDTWVRAKLQSHATIHCLPGPTLFSCTGIVSGPDRAEGQGLRRKVTRGIPSLPSPHRTKVWWFALSWDSLEAIPASFYLGESWASPPKPCECPESDAGRLWGIIPEQVPGLVCLLFSSAHLTLPTSTISAPLYSPPPFYPQHPIFQLPLATGTFLLQMLWATFPIITLLSHREIAVGNPQGVQVGERKADSHNLDYLPFKNKVVKRKQFFLSHQNV